MKRIYFQLVHCMSEVVVVVVVAAAAAVGIAVVAVFAVFVVFAVGIVVVEGMVCHSTDSYTTRGNWDHSRETDSWESSYWAMSDRNPSQQHACMGRRRRRRHSGCSRDRPPAQIERPVQYWR